MTTNEKVWRAVDRINSAWANLSLARVLLLDVDEKEYARLVKIGDRLEEVSRRLSKTVVVRGAS